MLKNSIKFLVGNFKDLNNKKVIITLSLVSLFLRLPFFFRDYIDRDESTFILLGQSWVDGFLPYLQLWDLKPPLTFAFFAALISIFGKSFIALRIAGTVLVIVTAFFTYKISTRITSKKVALGAALGTVVLLSLFGSLQGVMSEHLSMAFFMPGLYLLMAKKSNGWFFIAGLLMGIVVMVKLNMAYPILFLGLYLCYEAIKTKRTALFWYTTLFGAGTITVILATILPYYLDGNSLVWWKSVILAPLEYTSARRYPLLKLAPFFLIITAFLFFAWKKKYVNFKDRTVLFLITAIVGVLVSFLKGGRINGHYLIQLHPMLVILVAITLNVLLTKYLTKIPKSVLFILLLVPVESYLEYGNIVRNKLRHDTFFNGEGFTVPDYINKNKLETKNILFLGYHIGYWNLGKLPPTMASTHPSNLCRDELFPFFNNPRKTSVEELSYIMEELRPKTVVLRKNKRIFDKKELEQNAYIEAYLEKHYKLHTTVENAEILQRLEGF
ncbi:ArnT family glycosyltransferase [Maribacter chungangensis]|uniref:ArnT family glycosyltransferase n=1 Tax=Maribacter chungangensis TaxID=1069117 RepID=A0ABW3B7G3_9FLAO